MSEELVEAVKELSREIATLAAAISCNPVLQNPSTRRRDSSPGTELKDYADGFVFGSEAENPKPAPKERRKYLYSVEFERFWKVYPRHENKIEASKAFIKSLQLFPSDSIIEAAKKYRDDPNRVAGFTKHAATWLNAVDPTDEAPLPQRQYDPAEAERLEREAERQRRIEAANRLAESTRGQPV